MENSTSHHFCYILWADDTMSPDSPHPRVYAMPWYELTLTPKWKFPPTNGLVVSWVDSKSWLGVSTHGLVVAEKCVVCVIFTLWCRRTTISIDLRRVCRQWSCWNWRKLWILSIYTNNCDSFSCMIDFVVVWSFFIRKTASFKKSPLQRFYPDSCSPPPPVVTWRFL